MGRGKRVAGRALDGVRGGVVMLLAGVIGAGCGGATANVTPSPQADQAAVEAVFAAQLAAIEAADAEAYIALHRLDQDLFLLGPVADAVAEGAEAVGATVREVFASAPPLTPSAEEHAFAIHGDAAWSFHVVTLRAEGSEQGVVYHATQVYARTSAGWRIASASWMVALPNETFVPMAAGGAFRTPVAITARSETGCSDARAMVEAYREGRALPSMARIEGSLDVGTAPGEVHPMTAERYAQLEGRWNAGALRASPGPGGVRVQRVGPLCVLAHNVQIHAEIPDGPTLDFPLRQTVVFDPAVGEALHANFGLVLPADE